MKAELHLVPEGNGKYTLPAASFNLTLEERRAICTFLNGIKVLTGFLSKREAQCVDGGPINNTLESSRLSCDANSVPTNCNQGYSLLFQLK